MKISETVPVFASEREEAEWWDAHAEQVDEDVAEAMANGTAENLLDFLSREGLLVDTQEVTLFVLPDDAAQARMQATRKGLRYEDYLTSLVHEGVKAAEAA